MKCPYCDGPISKHLMLLYFANNQSTEQVFNETSELSHFICKHNQKGSRYITYWANRNITVEGENGIVLDLKKVRQLQKKNSDVSKEDTGLPGQSAFTCSFDYDNPQQSTIWIDGCGEIHPEAYLCPHCWNFFPRNYFDHDNYVLLLIGPTHVGKSVFTASLLADGCQRIFGDIPVNQERLAGRFNQIECEKLQSESAKAIDEFRMNPHKLPQETKNAIPPVFMTFTLSRPGQEDYTFNVSLVDTKGEGWLNRDKKVTTFLKSCDGVLYFVEPSQSSRFIHKPSRCDGQNTAVSGFVQAGYESDGLPASSIFENTDADKDSVAAVQNKITDASEVFIKYFLKVDTPVDTNTPIALVLTKFDQLIEGTESRLSEDCDPVFFDQLKEFHNPATRRKLLDPSALMLHNVAATSLFKNLFPTFPINNGSYQNVNCFCTSSFTGEPNMTDEKGYLTEEQYNRPYNIHLPFLWLLSQILEPDGKKQAGREEAELTSETAPSFSRITDEPRGRTQEKEQPKTSNARHVHNMIDDD